MDAFAWALVLGTFALVFVTALGVISILLPVAVERIEHVTLDSRELCEEVAKNCAHGTDRDFAERLAREIAKGGELQHRWRGALAKPKE